MHFWPEFVQTNFEAVAKNSRSSNCKYNINKDTIKMQFREKEKI